MTHRTPEQSLTGALAVATLLMIAGCATAGADRTATQNLSPRDAARLTTALATDTLQVRLAGAPGFYADTPLRRMLGLVGVISMLHEGNRLVEAFHLSDPAWQVAQVLEDGLLEAVQPAGGPARVRVVADGGWAAGPSRSGPSSPADPAQPASNGLQLEVQTVNWDFRPSPADSALLHVRYSAHALLRDLDTGAVLARGNCRNSPDTAATAAEEDVLKDNGRWLRRALGAAGTDCAQRLLQGAFGNVVGTLRMVSREARPSPAGRDMDAPTAQTVTTQAAAWQPLPRPMLP